MPRSKIPAKTRAAAIADLQAGEQPALVAQRYGLSSAMVRDWKREYVVKHPTGIPTDIQHPTPGHPVAIRPSIEQAQFDIAQLIRENLEAKLIATKRIAEYAANSPEWLEKQSAAELGELFERIDRSAIAILDRMAGAGRAAPTGGSEDTN
jgi:transposase-like protein